MSDLNKTNVESKRFTIELDTGQKKKQISGTGSLYDPSGVKNPTINVPITVKVPNLFTRSDYTVFENGDVGKVNSKVFQKVTKETWDKLESTNKDSRTFQTGSGTNTEYYALLATRDGETNKYAYTTAVDKVFVSARDASLFKRDIARENKGETSSISTVSAATQKIIQFKEGLDPKSPNNKTGLSPNGPSVDKAPQQNALEIRGNPIRRKYPELRYPKDRHPTQDHIQFKMLEYKGLTTATLGGIRSGTNALRTLAVGKNREFGTIEGSVTLPMQSKISDLNTVEWGDGQINPLQAVGLGILTADSPFGQVDSLIKQLENKEGLAGNVLTAGKVLAFQEALQVKGLLARTTGAIFNPNTELLFRGPQLRPFGFSFFLAARSQSEASEIKQIIRFFKQGMSIKETPDNLFLKTPNVFNIRYVFGRNGQDHPGLNRIKTCALKSCSVDYNPDNTFMTFEDGTMTAYRITMQFQELLPITESDYLSADHSAAGTSNFLLAPELDEFVTDRSIGF